MIQYGFEKEYFIKASDQYVLVPAQLPKDDCGYLVEARGEEHKKPLSAAFLLMAEERRILGMLPEGHQLTSENTLKLPVELKRAAARRFGKEQYPKGRGNIYGKDYSARDSWDRAGLHVHFSKQEKVVDSTGKFVKNVTQMIDFNKIIAKMDEGFADDIKEAKRVPGFYEFKVYGFEYRSLPAHVDLLRVADFVEKEISPLI